MKRVSVPDANRPEPRKKPTEPSECQALHSLYDHLWRTFLEPVLSDNPDGAHAFALIQHRIKEIIERGPEGAACAISLLTSNIRQAHTDAGAYQAAFKQFELHLAEASKAEAKIEPKATKKLAGDRPADCPIMRDLFDYLWRAFLKPAMSTDPDAAYAFALMQYRIGEAIERGPEGVACAISLLTDNIKRAFKYTKAHKERKVSFEVYERYLNGDESPEDDLGLI